MEGRQVDHRALSFFRWTQTCWCKMVPAAWWGGDPTAAPSSGINRYSLSVLPSPQLLPLAPFGLISYSVILGFPLWSHARHPKSLDCPQCPWSLLWHRLLEKRQWSRGCPIFALRPAANEVPSCHHQVIVFLLKVLSGLIVVWHGWLHSSRPLKPTSWGGHSYLTTGEMRPPYSKSWNLSYFCCSLAPCTQPHRPC